MDGPPVSIGHDYLGRSPLMPRLPDPYGGQAQSADGHRNFTIASEQPAGTIVFLNQRIGLGQAFGFHAGAVPVDGPAQS